MKVGTALCAVSLLALAALQHGIPENVALLTTWGLNVAGAAHLQQTWTGHTWPRLDPGLFIVSFRLLLGTAWIGYALLLGAGLRGGRLDPRRTLLLVGALAGFLALGCPPTLSQDVYAYAGYARMQVLHGLNPYLHTPADLRARGDEVAKFLWWDLPSVYGPVWLGVSFGVVAVFREGGLWWQVAAFRLLGGVALVGAALAGQAVARHFAPRRADLALAAIGLNPLFLIEGPMSGHNDLPMAALVLAAGALVLKGRDLSGSLVLGLAVGIKLVPLVLVPWLMLASARRCRGRTAGLGRALLVLGLVLLPTVIGYVPLWEGVETFTAQRVRLHMDWDLVRPDMPLLQEVRLLLRWRWPLVVIYAVLSIWLWRQGKEGDWLTAWAVLAVALMFFIVDLPYPWYLLWPLSASLTRWDRFHVALSAACLGLAVIGTMGYTVAWWWW